MTRLTAFVLAVLFVVFQCNPAPAAPVTSLVCFTGVGWLLMRDIPLGKILSPEVADAVNPRVFAVLGMMLVSIGVAMWGEWL